MVRTRARASVVAGLIALLVVVSPRFTGNAVLTTEELSPLVAEGFTQGPGTVSALGGPIVMTGTAQSTAGGDITYEATGDITVGRLTAGGGATVTSTGGSILDGNGVTANLSAGGSATLAAAGVIGTAADPLDAAVSGLANVNAAGSQSGVSIAINGTTGDGTLHFSLAVPGQIVFNGVLLHPIVPPTPPAPPLPPAPLRPSVPTVTIYNQMLASCEEESGAGASVRAPAACAASLSAPQTLTAPPPELDAPR